MPQILILNCLGPYTKPRDCFFGVLMMLCSLAGAEILNASPDYGVLTPDPEPCGPRSQLRPMTSAEPRPSKRCNALSRGFVNAPGTDLELGGFRV